MAQQNAFTALEQISLSDLRDHEWDAYYKSMSPWMLHADKDIRRRAINRVYLAVSSAEPQTRSRHEVGKYIPSDNTARFEWFLAAVDAAHLQQPDVIPLVLEHMRFGNHLAPEHPVSRWLKRLQTMPPSGVDPAVVEGTILLHEPFDENDPQSVARVVGMLDHQSNYVRACAARLLSGLESEALDPAAMFALIKDKEIIRPGIAGPYWSEWAFFSEHAPTDPLNWMLEILEKRTGPEPEDMPFNGIDFHLHEVGSYTPSAVLRMIKLGNAELAVQTATEMLEVVPGMEPVLRELADHDEVGIRRRAQFHLAAYYRVLHPEAEQRGAIRRWSEWSQDADVFSFHHGDKRALWFLTLYPRDIAGAFTNERAWSLIDKALPPGLRGEVETHRLDISKTQPPGPYRLGKQSMWQFNAGASVDLSGDPDAQTWTRIDITGRKLGERWRPFET
jgi:hypothetical protein